jgi:hypothetical protein
MLFHSFNSQDERRDYGGSAFIEIQFCRLPVGTSNKKIVAISNIINWQNDSLYVDCEEEFYREYSSILGFGMYSNLSNGPLDIYGINYYSPSAIVRIIEALNREKPMDYEILLDWLNKAKIYNGFYVLGI